MASLRIALSLLPLPLLFAGTAQAETRGEVAGAAYVEPASVPVRTPARFVGEMCNTGTTSTGGTVFLGTYIPNGVGYRVVSRPFRGVCRGVLTGSYTYIFCTAPLRPGQCGAVNMDVTPTAVGDVTLYVLADPGGVLRETNEADNSASVVLTAY